MFCPKCGVSNPDGNKFCISCGSPLPVSNASGRRPAAAGTPRTVSAPSKQPASKQVDIRKLAVLGAAVLVVIFLITRLFGGGSKKEDKFLEQIQGYWAMETQVYGDGTSQIDRPWNIGITENAIQLDSNRSTCPISEAEFKDGALYFSAQWYESLPINGQEPGMQNYDLRLICDKSGKLLTLEVKVSNGWGALGEYARAD